MTSTWTTQQHIDELYKRTEAIAEQIKGIVDIMKKQSENISEASNLINKLADYLLILQNKEATNE